jgi:hypothetical protein
MICFRRRYPGTELHRYYVGQRARARRAAGASS